MRDRDVAAEIIGVSLTGYKMIAFAISSAYAAIVRSPSLDVHRIHQPRLVQFGVVDRVRRNGR